MAPQGGFAKGQLMSWAADRSQDQSLGHFRHDDQCGICSGLLELDERCVGCKAGSSLASNRTPLMPCR